MKGEFFRPCPKCGRLCNSELDMCEICSGKIAKPEPPKPIIPVVAPVVEPIVEEVAPVVEEQVATEEVIGEVTTEENIVEETTDKEKQEEVVAPVIETKAPKGKGAKGLYALVAVLMLVIVALIVVIMQDKQPDITVNNTTLQSNTTNSTTLKQETEITTEITEGTTTENAGETLAPVTTTKKAQNTNKETTTKKNTSSSTKETTTKTNKVEFNPQVEFKSQYSGELYAATIDGVSYYYSFDYKIKNYKIEETKITLTAQITSIIESTNTEPNKSHTVNAFDKMPIKGVVVGHPIAILYTKDNIEYDAIYFSTPNLRNLKVGETFEAWFYIPLEDVENISKIVIV